MVSIDNVANVTNEEWDEMWLSSETATYFHSREWAELWRTYTKGAMFPDPLTILFSDGIKVVLPVMRQNYYQGIIKRYALTGPPFISKYGNWIGSKRLSKNHISLLTNYIVDNFRNFTWQLNPFDDASQTVNVNSKYAVRVPHIAYAVDLKKGEDIIYANLKSSCRNHIKQAIKNKLIVSECKDIDHWKVYHNIYLDTVKRWGSKTPYTIDWTLFELLYNKDKSVIKLWLVWHNEIAIAGSINFYSNRKIIGWHMASLTEYRHLRPVHLLEYSMIQDGIKNNYEWYDLGTDGGNKGLGDFKRSFGPEKLMCDKITKWSPLLYYIYNAKAFFTSNRMH
jgi:hypothetical protein